MKKIIQIGVAVVVIAGTTGCASTKAYFVDRGRDAADIFTATYGYGGGGAKARVGPIGTGLMDESPMYGLRGGDIITPYKMIEDGVERQRIFMGSEFFVGTTQSMARAKSYLACMLFGINIPLHPTELDRAEVKTIASVQKCRVEDVRTSRLAYLTQIEIAVGTVRIIRLGFNPGELLDFALGWFDVDIFGDDIEIKNLKAEKEKSNQTSHRTDNPAVVVR